jgi:hypothetical protein
VQFGQASNGSVALRSALGKPAKSSDYVSATEAHARGAVLLSAVFQAFLEIYDARIGFRARGIFPQGVRNFSEENLRWQPPQIRLAPGRMGQMLGSLDLTWNLSSDRKQSYLRGESNGFLLWQWLQKKLSPEEAAAMEAELGVFIRAGDQVPKEIPTSEGGAPLLQIHSVRPARRINSRGQQLTDLVVEAIQRFIVTDPATGVKTTHRGGFTLLIDMENERIRYAVRKRVGSATRIQAEQRFMGMAADGSQSYFDVTQEREPFAMLHRGE